MEKGTKKDKGKKEEKGKIPTPAQVKKKNLADKGNGEGGDEVPMTTETTRKEKKKKKEKESREEKGLEEGVEKQAQIERKETVKQKESKVADVSKEKENTKIQSEIQEEEKPTSSEGRSDGKGMKDGIKLQTCIIVSPQQLRDMLARSGMTEKKIQEANEPAEQTGKEGSIEEKGDTCERRTYKLHQSNHCKCLPYVNAPNLEDWWHCPYYIKHMQDLRSGVVKDSGKGEIEGEAKKKRKKAKRVPQGKEPAQVSPMPEEQGLDRQMPPAFPMPLSLDPILQKMEYERAMTQTTSKAKSVTTKKEDMLDLYVDTRKSDGELNELSRTLVERLRREWRNGITYDKIRERIPSMTIGDLHRIGRGEGCHRQKIRIKVVWCSNVMWVFPTPRENGNNVGKENISGEKRETNWRWKKNKENTWKREEVEDQKEDKEGKSSDWWRKEKNNEKEEKKGVASSNGWQSRNEWQEKKSNEGMENKDGESSNGWQSWNEWKEWNKWNKEKWTLDQSESNNEKQNKKSQNYPEPAIRKKLKLGSK